MPAFIRATNGNSIPKCDIGVRMLVFGRYGKLRQWCTFLAICWSRRIASLSLIGWMEIRARHLDMMHCATIFHRRVIGVRMVSLGNLKPSMKSCSPWYHQTGSFTFAQRNSNSPTLRGMSWYVMIHRSIPACTVMDGIFIVFAMSPDGFKI